MTLPTLRHYSSRRFDLAPKLYVQRPNNKPMGFWVSVPGEDDWPSYCRDWRPDRLAHEYEVTLRDDANLLMIETARALRLFGAEYRVEYPVTHLSPSSYYIDWARVREEGYDGIVIAPYQWECRLDSATDWYYAWDVASGCIWNLEAIASLDYVGAYDVPEGVRA